MNTDFKSNVIQENQIKHDLLGNRISMWDQEKDTITKDATPLIAPKSEQFFYENSSSSAYSINTAIGLFMPSKQKTVLEKIDIGEGKFQYHTKYLPVDLLLDDGNSCIPIMENVKVWQNAYYDAFMVFTSNVTRQTFLIDSRGTIFEVPCILKADRYGIYLFVDIDKKHGCYLINGFKAYYLTPEQRTDLANRTKPIVGATYNKDFSRFCNNNAHNETGYLYLTAGESKCGALVSYFARNGMKYETVPNILYDDDTLNVRIPLDGSNISREDVQFLLAKYKNSYSVYGVPIEQIGGGIEFPKKISSRSKELNYYLPKGKEAQIYSIVATLRVACNKDDDYSMYKKTIGRVIKLFERGKSRPKNNQFNDILLLHIEDDETNDAYALSRLDYINSILNDIKDQFKNKKQEYTDFIESLKADGFNVDGMKETFASTLKDYKKGQIDRRTVSRKYPDAIFGRGQHFSKTLYEEAYYESKRRYKSALQNYESAALSDMTKQGIKISKWKNESNLFALIAKEYPDAILFWKAV